MIRRREFTAGLGGAVAWPLAAGAQQPEHTRRIGILIPNSDPHFADLAALFREELAKWGWVEGRNLLVDLRAGDGDVDRMRAQAAELVRLTPEAVVTYSGTATRAVQL